MFEIIKASGFYGIYLIFANNTILSCFFLFLLVIGLYILITAVILQIVNSTADPALL